jgi:predicted 3-demethylubiquinone-9 3-methyltransferase (glyoxalase superfamily)
MQKIIPFLWFDNNAEEAINFYTSVFKNGKIKTESRIGDDNKLMTATFEIEGQIFQALNGGPMFTFSPAISFFVNCDTQEEIDELWEKLSEGGEQQRCGWVKDKFGVSWQIVPPILGSLLNAPDKTKANQVMQAMLQMDKIVIIDLIKAFES